jgi:hypothetical protein
MYVLKTLSRAGVDGALTKAERYRLLNEPAQAESICRDILDVDPDNQAALVCFVLAQTDQIAHDKRAFQSALAAISHLQSEYDRAYYAGIAWERRARALHAERSHGTNHSVYEWIVKALTHFGKAEQLSSAGNDDAVLRWNTCVRFLDQHPEVTARSEDVPEAILSE